MKRLVAVQAFKWYGSITGLLGAFTIALNLGISKYAFFIFTASALCWLYAGYRAKDHPLIYMNLGYLGINFIGIYRWFF